MENLSKPEPKIETTSLNKQEIVVDDIMNPSFRLQLPKLEPGRAYPAQAADYNEDQIKALDWLQFNSLHYQPEQIVLNGVSRLPTNVECDKFKTATPMEQHQVMKILGYWKDSDRKDTYVNAKAFLDKLVFNGTLSRDQESELIQTHYYEELFKAIAYDVPALRLIKGIITGKSQTVRLMYQDAITFTYTTDSVKAEITPGANISRDVGTYASRDITMTSYGLIAEVEDHLRRDAIQDPMQAEVYRLSQYVNFFQNYQIDKKWYDSAGDTVHLTNETTITLAEFRTACSKVNGLKYDANEATLEHSLYWKLMGDTAIGWYSYAGRETPVMNGGRIPPLFGVNLAKEIQGMGYYDTNGSTDTGPKGLVVDNRWAGFLVQRYPPIIENFRIYERAANATSLQWMIAAGLLQGNAICHIGG